VILGEVLECKLQDLAFVDSSAQENMPLLDVFSALAV